jgi:hypothetical protein
MGRYSVGSSAACNVSFITDLFCFATIVRYPTLLSSHRMQTLQRRSLDRQGCVCGPNVPRARQWQPPRLLVRAAGGNGAEKSADKKLDVEKQREIAKMLLTTQKNMLALNNSRVKVQEELAVANRRIADLGASVGSWLLVVAVGTKSAFLRLNASHALTQSLDLSLQSAR